METTPWTTRHIAFRRFTDAFITLYNYDHSNYSHHYTAVTKSLTIDWSRPARTNPGYIDHMSTSTTQGQLTTWSWQWPTNNGHLQSSHQSRWKLWPPKMKLGQPRLLRSTWIISQHRRLKVNSDYWVNHSRSKTFRSHLVATDLCLARE